jgi:F-box protein 9
METTSKDEDDTVELARFRQEWLAELQRKLSGTVTGTATSASTQLPTKESIRYTNESILEATYSQEPIPSHRNLVIRPASKEDVRTVASSSLISKALKIYRQAVAHEQRNELDQALLLYRQAFRLVCFRVFTMKFNTHEILLG